MSGSNWPAAERQPHDRYDTIDIGGCAVDVFNVEREVWRGVPKARLIEYYHSVAPVLLPYLKDRPQSLHLKPSGASAPGFYIKDMEARQPNCAAMFTDTRRHPVKGKRNRIDYLVCNNEATLLWMINLGCVDINPWNSRMQHIKEPDYVIIDLDPSADAVSPSSSGSLFECALAVKAWCDKHKVKAFAKTSGQTGMHFYIPCSGFGYADARRLAELICLAVHATVPGSSTVENSITRREDKVYLDPSQNDYSDTLAAPYSARPYHIPTVSTPLGWKEIGPQLDPTSFTLDSLTARLKKKGDLFAGVLDKKIAAANAKILSKL